MSDRKSLTEAFHHLFRSCVCLIGLSFLKILTDLEMEHVLNISDGTNSYRENRSSVYCSDGPKTTHALKQDQLEVTKRENAALLEKERQQLCKNNSLLQLLKNEKEEVQKLQNIIASRSTQHNHNMKRKEREYNKLKERLYQLVMDKKDKKI
ncbi:hypothetical protein AB205_0116130 [Aquarana catesbeiana]|uniref:Uncharacterized protein n=1 Tax=Aquarana catesbeiana TaxID=8400 RepID=A0A2G9SM12_AQUCT|nr:hypothetical protein AB205_0116130 [Aquarana catesbeiana]